MLKLIKNNIQGTKVLILFVITQIVYFSMIFITIPKITSIDSNIKVFDIRPFGYTYTEAVALLNQLGEKGRAVYLYQQIPLDLIYPGLFAISFCLVLAYFLNKLNLLNTNHRYWTLLPLVSASFDYLENFCIIKILNSYPDFSEQLVSIASTFTIFKSLLTTLYFLVLIFVLLRLGYKKFL